MDLQSEKSDLPNFKVLTVDDNAQFQDLLEAHLSNDGISLDMACDGKDGLDFISRTKYAAILVDLYMPGMKGTELIREIRLRDTSVKIIALSQTDSYADILDSYKNGADYFITKPYNKDYLRVLVHRCLGNIEFFKNNWAAIRERWVEGVPKHRLLTEKNIIEETDAFLHNSVFDSAPYHRVGLLVDPLQQSSSERSYHSDGERVERLAALIATVPHAGDYVAQAQNLDELNHSFRREMAIRLEPILNAHIQAMPRGTHDEKKAVARWVNEELRRFDLAIKCPKTGEPSSLLAGPGNHPEIGRFMIEHKSPEGKRIRSVQTPELPYLELMEAAPRRGAILEWQEKVGPQRGGAKRG